MPHRRRIALSREVAGHFAGRNEVNALPQFFPLAPFDDDGIEGRAERFSTSRYLHLRPGLLHGSHRRQVGEGRLPEQKEQPPVLLIRDRRASDCRSRRAWSRVRCRGERQLSPFRSWEFDAAVIVLFDDDYEVSHAAKLPVVELRERARWAKHVNGWLVFATPDVLNSGEDWTERLRQVQSEPASRRKARALRAVWIAARPT